MLTKRVRVRARIRALTQRAAAAKVARHFAPDERRLWGAVFVFVVCDCALVYVWCGFLVGWIYEVCGYVGISSTLVYGQKNTHSQAGIL